MKIGIQVYYFGWSGGLPNIAQKLGQIAKTAEGQGFSSLWVMDHLFQLGAGFGPPGLTHIEAPMLEAYCTLSFLAAITKQIKLGVMVTSNLFRYPGVLIKQITTLDVLSGGRTYFGIGTGGGMQREAKGLGIPLPRTPSEAVERLEETLQLAKQMWKGDPSPFEGTYYQLAEPLNRPQPISRPHPPIMIGMWRGGKRMLQLVAKYSDAFNLQIGAPFEDYPPYIRARYHEHQQYLTERIALLKQICDEEGRKYDEIERTVLCTIRLSPQAMNSNDVLTLCQDLAEIGIQHVIFNMPNLHQLEPLHIIGEEVIPQVANL